jgi:hypothetical protein
MNILIFFENLEILISVKEFFYQIILISFQNLNFLENH